jgi:tetratricopeptide (TPR) repeat protein
VSLPPEALEKAGRACRRIEGKDASAAASVPPPRPGHAPWLIAAGLVALTFAAMSSAVAAQAPAASRAAKKPAASASAPAVSPSDAADALRFTRTVPQENPALEQAYEALLSGRDDEARRAYEKMLRADGRNVDVLLGLATLAVRHGEADAARAYYLRALEADPSDATAQAGVLAMGGRGDETAAESRLKTMLAARPDSPPLNFALGCLYARQGRWSEAEQAYFQAHAGDPGNPDLIFNLAVSLDHLRQDKLAARYYRAALDASAIRAASFARDAVGVRLKELATTGE